MGLADIFEFSATRVVYRTNEFYMNPQYGTSQVQILIDDELFVVINSHLNTEWGAPHLVLLRGEITTSELDCVQEIFENSKKIIDLMSTQATKGEMDKFIKQFTVN